MNTPVPAVWIDTVFSPLVLSFLHRLTVGTQAFFVQPLAYWGAITDDGIVFIVLGGMVLGCLAAALALLALRRVGVNS